MQRSGKIVASVLIFLLPAMACLSLFTVTWADFEAGSRAHERGDYAIAFREFLPLARQGDARAQFGLGRMYDNGQGVPQDYAEAAKWYRRAAEQGHAEAQFSLGIMYVVGQGVPHSYSEAVVWYRRAAEQGHAEAQFALGIRYANGQGVPQDHAEAARWYGRAAAQGHAHAQFNLALMYAQGRGVPRDDVQALRWYRHAADQGIAEAQFALALMYAQGRGVPQNDSEAAKWYRHAAEQGQSRAQNNLGTMYENGRGVLQDYVAAHMWYNLAASSAEDDEEAKSMAARNRDKITWRLTPAQLALAQQMAREWKPKQETAAVVGSSPRPSSAPHAPLPAEKPPEIDSTGTGFVVSKRGHVLTNYHVIDGCRVVRAGPPSGTRITTRVLAGDPKNDLALLLAPVAAPSPAPFREGRGLRPGDGVVAIGFPLRGLLASAANVTTGVISALAGLGDDTRYLQITAPVQAGNSGGPLLDQSGNVVGVVVGKLDALKVAQVTGDIPQNVNFAIHAAVARAFLEANGVDFETAPSTRAFSPADIGERAKSFTVIVECWK